MAGRRTSKTPPRLADRNRWLCAKHCGQHHALPFGIFERRRTFAGRIPRAYYGFASSPRSSQTDIKPVGPRRWAVRCGIRCFGAHLSQHRSENMVDRKMFGHHFLPLALVILSGITARLESLPQRACRDSDVALAFGVYVIGPAPILAQTRYARYESAASER